jgi:hypothetical protein
VPKLHGASVKIVDGSFDVCDLVTSSPGVLDSRLASPFDSVTVPVSAALATARSATACSGDVRA